MLFLSFCVGNAPVQENIIKYTYVGNMGVLVDDGTHQILIDGLHLKYEDDYLYPPQELLDSLIYSKGHYKIDMLLFTHVHKDHFNVKPAIAFLKHNSKAKLIAPQQIIDTLKKNVLFGEVAQQTMSAENTEKHILAQDAFIRPVKLIHTWPKFHSWVTNYSYIISANGINTIHVGDSESSMEVYKNNIFANEQFDIAIVPMWFLGKKIASTTKKYIKAKKFIISHISPVEKNGNEYEIIAKKNKINAVAFDVLRESTTNSH
jgi:L-ascorbate metabolism protein UlaG (beta-lactamase superfamily)